VKATSEVRSAAQFVASLDSTLPAVGKIIHQRCEELVHLRKGVVYGQETTPITHFACVEKFEEQLGKGAVWASEPSLPERLRCELKEWPADVNSVPAENWASTWLAPVLPPLASKLCRESNLREMPCGRNA
jgi:hypothetical protein